MPRRLLRSGHESAPIDGPGGGLKADDSCAPERRRCSDRSIIWERYMPVYDWHAPGGRDVARRPSGRLSRTGPHVDDLVARGACRRFPRAERTLEEQQARGRA